jgi:hypothetical protein
MHIYVTSPVSLDDERLIRDGETAAAAYAKSGRESIMPMAMGLVAARRKYPSNQEFGTWFDQSSYPEVVTNHSMRAALIYIGEHDEIAAPIIEHSRSVDPVAIAAAIKEIVVPSSQKVKTAEAVQLGEAVQPTSDYVVALKKFCATTQRAIDRASPAKAAVMNQIAVELDRSGIGGRVVTLGHRIKN